MTAREPLPASRRTDLGLDPWRRLFSLAARDAEDRRTLAGQLERWCADRGDRVDAALYVDGGDGLRRFLCAGKTPFPLELDLRAELEPGWRRIDLPDAAMVHTGDGDEPDAALLLLAAGARISGLKREIQEHSFQAAFRGVELEALYDVGLAIASTLDLEELGEEVLLRAVSLLDARRGALYLLSDGRYRLTSRFGGAARAELGEDEIDVDAIENGLDAGPEDWIPGASHLLAVPVEIDGDPRGLLVVADKESRRGVGPFPATDRRTLALFANQAAIALENAKLHRLALEKERLEREMELAAEIQQQLLPKTMPAIPGFEVIGWNRPARHAGGDYFDFKSLGEDGWGLVVGDVVGKGLPAALLVSTLHSALRLLLDQMKVGPALVERLNRHIFESSSANKFITLLLAAVDCRTSRLAYLNAGHNPGLLVRADGEIEELASSGMPLGLMPDGSYEASVIELERGDLVCVYSDGITECASPDEEEYGLERLKTLLATRRTEPLPDILRAIDDAVTRFAQDQPQGDDQTVVLLRCGGDGQG